MRISLWQWVAVFGVALTIVLFVLAARLDFATLPPTLLAVNVVLSLVFAGIVTGILVMLIVGVAWTYSRRRRPLAWFAIRVLAAATKQPYPSVGALGILSRDGSLAVSLPRRLNDFVTERDSFLAFRVQDGEHLGIVSVIIVNQDSYLCMVTDRMAAQDFWNGLEFRMASNFSPPAGVEFSRYIDQIDMDFARRLIRSWGG